YNKDLQEDKSAVFSAEDTTTAAARAMTTVIRSLTLRGSRTHAAASGLLLATEVADYLVSRGVPVRTAHEITGRIVRDLDANGRDFSALTIDDWRRCDAQFDETIRTRGA